MRALVQGKPLTSGKAILDKRFQAYSDTISFVGLNLFLTKRTVFIYESHSR